MRDSPAGKDFRFAPGRAVQRWERSNVPMGALKLADRRGRGLLRRLKAAISLVLAPLTPLNRRVLFVDDKQDVLDGLERLLSRHYDVHTAESPEEALLLLSREPFAVLVCDEDMPSMRGSELLERVAERWPAISRIMLTGVADRSVAIDSIEKGRVLHFLDKPASYERLREALNDGIEKYASAVDAAARTDRLSFSRDAMADFLESLAGRVENQNEAVLRLHQFVHELSSTESLEAIARLCACAVHDMLPESGVFVELFDATTDHHRAQASAGPSYDGERYVQQISSPDGNLGAIQVSPPRRHRLTEVDRSMTASIAMSTAVAVHNQLRRRERDEAQRATIMAMAVLAEQRDNETGRHLERVSRYSDLIARGLRDDGLHLEVLTDEWIEDLYRSVPLHDIGKVGIPDRILLKPTRLDADEWETMKQHTTIGAETLRSVMDDHATSFLRMSLDIAWCHHEKWDGSGYPRGLRGAEIPLSARILALADVYDALTTVRPYKQAWTHAEALDWIRGGGGSHFDPEVVAAFVARADQANAIRVELADERPRPSVDSGPRAAAV